MQFTKTKLALALAGLALFGAQAVSAAPLASGNTVMIADGPGNGPGGEFILTYASGSFLSFCVEHNEFINVPGGPYTVTLNSNAVNGGTGFAATYGGFNADVSGAAGADPLSNATAWVYSKYLAGALSGQIVGNAASADKAQAAIWFLENETGGALNSWATAAIAAVNGGWTNPGVAGHVYVLNLTAADGLHQDQLYMAPIPEPETYAMLLAGLGLMGFVARRRQRTLAAA